MFRDVQQSHHEARKKQDVIDGNMDEAQPMPLRPKEKQSRRWHCD